MPFGGEAARLELADKSHVEPFSGSQSDLQPLFRVVLPMNLSRLTEPVGRFPHADDE